MTYTFPKFESEQAPRNQTDQLQNLSRLTREHREEKKTVQQECIATNLLTYMGGITGTVLKTMIQSF